MRVVEVLEFTRFIEHYCQTNNVAVLYYEINCREDRRDDVVAFYDGKIDRLLLNPMKRDDDNFIVFPTDNEAIQYAETNFPYQSDLISSGTDMEFFIHCRVWHQSGAFSWENKDGGVTTIPEAQPPA